MDKHFRIKLAAVLTCVPVAYLAFTLEIYVGPILVMLNTLIRLFFPAGYIPARQSLPGIIGHPCMARTIATVAEFEYFYKQTVAFGLPWAGPCGFLTILGEIVCWTSIYYQSEIIGWAEDFIWTTYFATALISSMSPLAILVCTPMTLYMILVHLPRQWNRVKAPYLKSYTGSK